MEICFISNYLTHHQLPFCLELDRLTDKRFTFVETESLTEERKSLGYQNLGEAYDFVSSLDDNNRLQIEARILESDVVLIGSAPAKLIAKRLKEGRLTLRYSERIFKKGDFDILRRIKHTVINRPYREGNLYYLLSSAYAAHDYVRCGADQSKMFKWGYYPETRRYESIEDVIGLKHHASILWVARLIGLKHPEVAIGVADRLKKDGYDFTLNIIGIGEKEKEIEDLITQKGLQKQVHMLGSMSPENVRNHMEKSEILLFTSDRNEGWGAVLNEAMNSGCAVVANDEIGSVPFLIKDGENGLTYHKGNVDELYQKVKQLLDKKEYREQLGASAYRTITEEWCAEVAAERLIHTCENLLKGNKVFYENGPCSKAGVTPSL